MKTKYQVQTGGKLYLAGEYAVLTPGYGAVIQFIPIYLSATICLLYTSDAADE